MQENLVKKQPIFFEFLEFIFGEDRVCIPQSQMLITIFDISDILKIFWNVENFERKLGFFVRLFFHTFFYVRPYMSAKNIGQKQVLIRRVTALWKRVWGGTRTTSAIFFCPVKHRTRSISVRWSMDSTRIAEPKTNFGEVFMSFVLHSDLSGRKSLKEVL